MKVEIPPARRGQGKKEKQVNLSFYYLTSEVLCSLLLKYALKEEI